MRLQLTRLLAKWTAAIALCTAPALAQADPPATFSFRGGLYQDSDATSVRTTTVSARGRIKDRVTVETRYLLDVITSASVDVVTQATGKFHEARHEVMGGLGYADSRRQLGARYVHSRESDWTSHTASLQLSQGFLQDSVRLGISAGVGHNSIGRADDRVFRERLMSYHASGSVAWTASVRDVVSLAYSLAWLHGYQASPYRTILVPELALELDERVPELRTRHALTARWNRHLFRDSALRSQLRGYLDDWGVVSATLDLEYVIGLRDWSLALHLRGYGQRHASFYRPRYRALAPAMTRDRELSSFVDVFGGLRLGYRNHRLRRVSELFFETRLDAFYFWFPEFPALPTRAGLVAEVALGVSL